MPRGAKTAKTAHADKGRDFPMAEDDQVYARVTKMLGNGRLMAACTDSRERMCKIRGSMRKREWVRVGDLVLVALRDFQDGKADVVFLYKDAEVHRLKRLGELAHLQDAPAHEAGDVDHAVEFEAPDEDDGEPWFDDI